MKPREGNAGTSSKVTFLEDVVGKGVGVPVSKPLVLVGKDGGEVIVELPLRLLFKLVLEGVITFWNAFGDGPFMDKSTIVETFEGEKEEAERSLPIDNPLSLPPPLSSCFLMLALAAAASAAGDSFLNSLSS